MLAMVGIVVAVAMRLFQTRIGEMKRRGIRPQQVASAKSMGDVLDDTRAADHFRNLFEMPVLFYVACLAAIQSGGMPTWALALGWAYAALRAAQAFIACTSNRVRRRAQAFGLSALVLFALWLVLGLVWAGVL